VSPARPMGSNWASPARFVGISLAPLSVGVALLVASAAGAFTGHPAAAAVASVSSAPIAVRQVVELGTVTELAPVVIVGRPKAAAIVGRRKAAAVAARPVQHCSDRAQHCSDRALVQGSGMVRTCL
jgi:hypothetical protein